MKKWNSIVAFAVGSTVMFSVPTFAYVGLSNTRDINAPIHVHTANQDRVTHVLPTGRIVSPVGLVNGAPNFVTAVVPVGHYVAAMANGATRAQTITLYKQKTLEQVAEIAAYKKGAPKEAPLPTDATNLRDNVIGHQSFFQGMAVGPDHTIYVAGGGGSDVAAFTVQDGNLKLLRRYPLAWQPFPKA
ncbi:quinoprotein amine dehydrogenase, beta chain-like protein, partial [Acidithiobacillus ferrooxidans]|nr:quinoprotein amine dehydrogenase, beta chain-like protein [Acidithiobacillus ferrooxidans]